MDVIKTTLISSYILPGNEANELGLAPVEMSRLGRFVVLAGKNGSGKTGLLNQLEKDINARSNALSNRRNLEDLAANANLALSQDPDSQHAEDWKRQFKNSTETLSFIKERVIGINSLSQFKPIKFVPKRLALVDPNAFNKDQLVARYQAEKQPGIDSFSEYCLFYIQLLQNRFWHISHQDYQGDSIEKLKIEKDYATLNDLLSALLNTQLKRNIDDTALLFDKPIAHAGLSDGQNIILQLCVALHAQSNSLNETAFLLDEPENHLHPAAAIELIDSLYKAAEHSQIWIATHSIPLIAYITSLEPMALWYVENGSVSHAGRKPELVLEGLLGGEDRIGQLNIFTGLPAQLAAINFAAESLFPPKTIANGKGDLQISQIEGVIASLQTESPLTVLDFGSGQCRLLDGLNEEFKSKGIKTSDSISYYAFDTEKQHKNFCIDLIGLHFENPENRYFNTPDNFHEKNDDGKISLVIMCNVLHEIDPNKWLNLFSEDSLISRALNDNGYLLVVEDQRIPIGEKAHSYGFIVLDAAHLRTLFGATELDIANKKFISASSLKNSRLKAHLVHKSLLKNVNPGSRRNSIQQLQKTAKEEIFELRNSNATYANGQLHGFWTQMYANTSLCLSDL